MTLSRRVALVEIFVVVCFLLLSVWFEQVWSDARAVASPSLDLVQMLLFPRALEAAGSVGLAFALLRMQRLPLAAVGVWKNDIERQALWGLGIAAATYAVLLVCAVLVVSAFHLLGGTRLSSAPWWNVTPQVAFASGDKVSSALLLFASGAIAEEVLFRGLLLTRLRRAVGRWWLAVVLCSLATGVAHWAGGPRYAVGAMVMGAVWSAALIRSRSLVAVTIGHFSFNVLQFAIGRFLEVAG